MGNVKGGFYMKKLISLLLVLVLTVAMLPMTVCAAPPIPGPGPRPAPEEMPDDVPPITDPSLLDTPQEKEAEPVHDPNKHEYGIAYNTKYHWLQCPCGCQISMEPHIDPKDAANDYCTCGYHFSDNADLVTLWVDGCPPIKNFSKNKTEYTLNAYTYKDVKSVKISTRTFDSQATVELPEDLTLKTGTNTIPVKVTAENQKATKTYTLTIVKE